MAGDDAALLAGLEDGQGGFGSVGPGRTARCLRGSPPEQAQVVVGQRVQRGRLPGFGEQRVEAGGDGFAPRGIVAAGVGIVGIMIEAGVATLEVADAGQAGAVDADPGSPAGRRVGNHVAAEQTEHGADLETAATPGAPTPVQTAEALSAPNTVRKNPPP